MPGLFSTPKPPAPPPIPAPVPMPVPASANQAQQGAIAAQTIAQTQAASGRQSTDLTRGSGTTLG
jgi:hypothetical protein